MLSTLLSATTLLLFSIASAQASNSSTVTISAGTVEGSQCTNSEATAFRAIPFAQPPVGDLRFAPPKPYNSNYVGGTLHATVPAPICIQFGTVSIVKGATSEDCLYLDIWVPPRATADSKLPVKVWIYGGGDKAGSISDPLYDGCNLAMANTVFVSINYRTGPLGFLALESAGINGNFGIQDVLLGLQWIQENIGAFGGDRGKVLLFGQSAGAVDVFTVATLPQAPSLFNAAVMESGGGRDAPLKTNANKIGEAYAKLLNCSAADIACLRSKSPYELNASAPLYTGADISGVDQPGFNPYVDGKVVPVQTSKTGVKVPSIFGSNTRDASLFLVSSNGYPRTVTQADYTSFLQRSFGPAASAVAERYPVTASNSTPTAAYNAMESVITDADYKCPTYRGLKGAIQNGIDTFTYLWNHTPTCPWTLEEPLQHFDLLGPTHTSEITYVFGNTVNLPLFNGTCNLTSAEQDISKTLVSAWSSMAASGNPSYDGVQWPTFNDTSSLGLNIGNATSVGYIDYSVCDFWDAVDAAQLQNATMADRNSTTAVNGSASATGSPGITSTPFTGSTASLSAWSGLSAAILVALGAVLLRV